MSSVYVVIDTNRLALARADADLTTREVADQLKAKGADKASPQSVLNHESGVSRPRRETVARYAKIYGIDLRELIA